jgi:hypothetical protein
MNTDELLAKVAAYIGVEKIELPTETQTDLMREAQSVLFYLQGQGDWHRKPCKQCNSVFAYSWDHDCIAYCSINCMKLTLQGAGLEWNPYGKLADRWGKTIPAVVPPQVLYLTDPSEQSASLPSYDREDQPTLPGL